ncbi:MAG: hypothetical protein IKX22_07955 [Prevotella sp.]|nr:hypothetical protein [Prevotella sp.]
MKRNTRIMVILALACLMIPGQVSAQKRKTQKRRTTATSRLVSHPQRDADFLSAYRLQPSGTFNLYNLDNNFVMLTPLDFNGYVLKRDMSRKQLTLRQVSCRENGITDDEEWFERNGLKRSEEAFPNEPNEEIRPRCRYNTDGYSVVTYGPYYAEATKLVIADPSLQTIYKAYDFERFKIPPGVNNPCGISGVGFVRIEGNIMYVSHNSYSDYYGKISDEQNGYLSAIDLRTNEILWTSEKKTCSSSIEIIGNSIICGYGSSFESDYLYVVDKYSGQRVQKIYLKKAPEQVIAKGNRIYVRTYSYDYVFSY